MWDMVGTVIGACRAVWVPGARLGYAAFDAQLRKAFFVASLYAIRTCTFVRG